MWAAEAQRNPNPQYGKPRQPPELPAEAARHPANQQALLTQGHTAADTKAFADAKRQLSTFNINQNATSELTDGNIKAGIALWEYIKDVLGAVALIYRETNPKKAKTYAVSTLLKHVRKKHGGGEDVNPA